MTFQKLTKDGKPVDAKACNEKPVKKQEKKRKKKGIMNRMTL